MSCKIERQNTMFYGHPCSLRSGPLPICLASAAFCNEITRPHGRVISSKLIITRPIGPCTGLRCEEAWGNRDAHVRHAPPPARRHPEITPHGVPLKVGFRNKGPHEVWMPMSGSHGFAMVFLRVISSRCAFRFKNTLVFKNVHPEQNYSVADDGRRWC